MEKHLNVKTVTTSIIVLTLGGLFILWVNGYFGLWTNGIKHLAHDPENTHHATVPYEEEYTVEIDLTNLESNEGKILYRGEEGQHIYVSSVLEHEDSGYEVIFRSKGRVNLNQATLVSGVEYNIASGNFGEELKATAFVEHQGGEHELESSMHTNLIHKDGDEFGFYLPPDNQSDQVEVTVTNLVANIWMDKDLFKPN